jgi:hypothetical protein
VDEQPLGQLAGQRRQPGLRLGDPGALLSGPGGQLLDQVEHVGQVDHLRLVGQPGDELLVQLAVVDRRVGVEPAHRAAQVGPPVRRVGEHVLARHLAEI